MFKKNPANYSFVFCFLLMIDQIAKFLLNKYYPEIISINKGIIFGFITNYFIVIFLLILGFAILFYLFFISKIKLNYSIILILAGAISNIIDRIAYGGVVDYINVKFWSNFNLADVYIVLGVIIFIYHNFKTSKKLSL